MADVGSISLSSSFASSESLLSSLMEYIVGRSLRRLGFVGDSGIWRISSKIVLSDSVDEMDLALFLDLVLISSLYVNSVVHG